MTKTIKIKYFTDKIEKLAYIGGKSDWVDLRSAEDVTLKKGEFKLIPLGIAMELPKGYEAHVVPRSSTYKNFGVIATPTIWALSTRLTAATTTSGLCRLSPCVIRRFMSMTGSVSSGYGASAGAYL